MRVKKVYLIRHGETDFNRAGRLQGTMPVPLNDNGCLQAESLGLYLKHHAIDAIFSSPLPRARQTADLIAQALDISVQADPRLQEISFGQFEGLAFTDIESQFPEEYRMWSSGDMSYAVPEGESRRQVQQRMSQAWDDLTSGNDYETIAVVSHGAALKILLQYIYYKLPSFSLKNTSITTLSRFGSVWELGAISETPHLND